MLTRETSTRLARLITHHLTALFSPIVAIIAILTILIILTITITILVIITINIAIQS